MPDMTGVRFKDQLGGADAFYEQADYAEKTRDDFSQKKALKEVTYRCDTEPKAWRIFKNTISVIIFPVGLCRLIHRLAGIIYLPASFPEMMNTPGQPPKYTKDHALRSRVSYGESLADSDTWKGKRITIKCDGYTIDAYVIGRKDTFDNGRWTLVSNGNGQFAEDRHDYELQQMLERLDSNAILFNYPSVGASSSATGLPSRRAMRKAYRAALAFLEDQDKGIGAKEIIGYGHSIGGVAQGIGLKGKKLNPDIKYCFVKSRTLSTMSKEAASMMGSWAHVATKIIGWNASSRSSSRELEAPEIIMQTADVNYAREISGQVIAPNGVDAKDISYPLKHVGGITGAVLSDGTISADAALLTAVANDDECPKGNKYFMGIPETHNQMLNPYTIKHLCDKIEEMLAGAPAA